MNCWSDEDERWIVKYCSTAMGVPGRTQGTMFTPVPLELIYHEPERVGGVPAVVMLILIFSTFEF